jgi:hypothetical protein
MSILAALLTLVLLAAVILVVSGPLRAARKPVESQTAERLDLLTAREAKYHEIRATELDYRTGKLSEEDFKAIDATLRGEALEILDRLEALDGRATAAEDGAAEGREGEGEGRAGEGRAAESSGAAEGREGEQEHTAPAPK